jgi:putative ABC transport system permease protein
VMRGLAAGCGLAVLVGLSARATLYGLDLHAGVLAFASVGMLFVLAGVVACYLPARHASHVDPNHVLRSE